MTAPAPPAPDSAVSVDILKNHLVARIGAQGPISFAEFMRECLYHPQHGYYMRPDARRFGDYYTSVDVHPIFGRLLARQLAQMHELLGAPSPFTVVEAGAGVGRLAQHILDFARDRLPELYSALQYVAVERSAARGVQLQQRLASHAAAGRLSNSANIPVEIHSGCVFSNELLDAMPVHRVVMNAGQLQEIYVGLEEGRFVEVTQALSTLELSEYFSRQAIHLAECQQAEVCLDACRWIQRVGHALGRGFVISIDYGYEANALYSEAHNRGTLLAYRQHSVTEDALAFPGGQDLTAHVNFTALDLWGRDAGLQRTGMFAQSQFLIALGRRNEFADLYEPGQSEVNKLRARLLLKNLIHPEGLGETFQVLIQHKGLAIPNLLGLSPW